MARRLIPWPRAALVLVGACLVVTLAGAVEFHNGHRATGVDAAVARWVHASFTSTELHAALKITMPTWVTGLTVLAAVIMLALRHFRLAALAGGGPLAAVLLTEFVLKPLVHREYGPPIVLDGHPVYAYPSGHETGVVSLTTVLVLLVVWFSDSRRAWLAAAIAAIVVDVVAALALVGNDYHFFTDTVGAFTLSVATVLGVGLVVDAVAARERQFT